MLYDLHIKPKSLIHHDKLDTHYPKTVWEKYKHDPEELKKRESTLAKDPHIAYSYARHILCRPFPPGEPAIAKDWHYSYLYATYVLRKPFPTGEPAIAKDGGNVEAYLRNFPERTEAIQKLQKKLKD